MEQYKIIRSRVADITNDRNAQNKFLLTICTAIIAAPIVALQARFLGGANVSKFGLILLGFPLIGAGVSWYWILWNRTYGEALAAGYRILKEMEIYLPAQPFSLEEKYRNEAAVGGIHKTTSSFTIDISRMFLICNILISIGILFAVVIQS